MGKWVERVLNTVLAVIMLGGIIQMCYSNEMSAGPGLDAAEGGVAGAVAAQ